MTFSYVQLKKLLFSVQETIIIKNLSWVFEVKYLSVRILTLTILKLLVYPS